MIDAQRQILTQWKKTAPFEKKTLSENRFVGRVEPYHELSVSGAKWKLT